MPELITPSSSKLVRLREQPHFPAEDLTEDNKEVLVYTLSSEAGVAAFADILQEHQRFLYQIAQAGLAQLGHKSKYDPRKLNAFSHGFAGFEAISDLVHKPRIHDNTLAVGQVARYLVDTTPRLAEDRSEEIDPGLKTILDGLMSDQDVRDDPQLEYLLERMTPEQDVEADENLLEPDYPSTEIPKDILRSLADAKRQRLQITDRHKPDADKMFADRQNVIPSRFPNTAEVLMAIGIKRGEDAGQIQARMAGAQFARTLQSID